MKNALTKTTRRRVFSFDDNRDSRTVDDPLAEDDRTNDRQRRAMNDATKKAVMERLTDKQQAAVILYYFEGKTQRQIARDWGVSPSSVSRLLSRAIARLRKLIIVR